MKALIFPNDPLISYFIKGELKDKYFNPNNIFSEIHFITFSKKECSIKDIKTTIGNAKCFIHSLPPLSIFDYLFPINRVKFILKLVKNYKFDVVRAFNPIIHGYIAGKISWKLQLPFILSLHGNYDLDIRYQYRKNLDIRYFKYLLTKYTVEKKSLKMATHIIGAYKFASRFAVDNGVEENKVSTIYNRVYFHIFRPETKKILSKVRVICVGRLIKEKGQRTLIKAFKNLDKNFYLTIVGDGDDYDFLLNMVKDFDLNKRIKFIKSIPNYKLATLYREHDIFALPIKYGGICIPALEATASGLALVMPKPLHENIPELINEYSEIVENSPDGFTKGIIKIATDVELRKKMINRGLTVISQFNGDIMELKESELYKKVIGKNEIN